MWLVLAVGVSACAPFPQGFFVSRYVASTFSLQHGSALSTCPRRCQNGLLSYATRHATATGSWSWSWRRRYESRETAETETRDAHDRGRRDTRSQRRAEEAAVCFRVRRRAVGTRRGAAERGEATEPGARAGPGRGPRVRRIAGAAGTGTDPPLHESRRNGYVAVPPRVCIARCGRLRLLSDPPFYLFFFFFFSALLVSPHTLHTTQQLLDVTSSCCSERWKGRRLGSSFGSTEAARR